MSTPIKHCAASVMHTRVWNEMRSRQAERTGRGSGNKVGIKHAEAKRKDPVVGTGKKPKGSGKRRVSFACRFAGMKGSMKDKKGEPTRYAMALKKWGFGSREAARNFCNTNKEK